MAEKPETKRFKKNSRIAIKLAGKLRDLAIGPEDARLILERVAQDLISPECKVVGGEGKLE